MTNWNALDALKRAQEDNGSDRRTAPRFSCADATCGKGTVLDLSKTGLRLRTKAKPPRGSVGLEIAGVDGNVRVGAEAVWVRKGNGRQYEIGFRFNEPTADAGLFSKAWDPCAGSLAAKRA